MNHLRQFLFRDQDVPVGSSQPSIQAPAEGLISHPSQGGEAPANSVTRTTKRGTTMARASSSPRGKSRRGHTLRTWGRISPGEALRILWLIVTICYFIAWTQAPVNGDAPIPAEEVSVAE